MREYVEAATQIVLAAMNKGFLCVQNIDAICDSYRKVYACIAKSDQEAKPSGPVYVNGQIK